MYDITFYRLFGNDFGSMVLWLSIATGLKTDVTFWAEEYRPVYESHVKSLTHFDAYSKSKELDLLGRVQRRLYNYGR